MWIKMEDSPLSAVAAGLVHSEDEDGTPVVAFMLQADTTRVVLDPEHAKAFIEGVHALLPYIVEQRVPDDLKGSELASEDPDKIAKAVRKNRKRLGLGRDG